MRYLEWNQRVFNRVFNEDREGKTTSVYIDEDILYAWAIEMNLKPATPEDAVKLFVHDCLKELKGESAKIAEYSLECAIVWERKNMLGAPEYIGMLALLVLSSTWGEGSGNLFYQRYWNLTGSDKKGMIPNIEQLRKCWRQLQQYSEKNSGNLGVYKVRTLAPSKVNVGVIVAQGVLRPADADALKDIFFEEGADTNVDYADQHVKIWLDKHRSKLSARAQKALGSQDNADYLISRVREELEEWDGEPADWTNQAGRTRVFNRTAYLCFNRGQEGEPYATIRLDFSGRSGDPESVIFENDNRILIAHSNGDAVSTPIETAPNSNLEEKTASKQLQLCEASDFQKYRIGEFQSILPGNTYKYSLIDKPVRVFVEGRAYGVDGYVESQGLRPGFGHIVMSHTSLADSEITKWCSANKDTTVDVKKYVPRFFVDNPIWSVTAVTKNSPACPVNRFSCLQYEVRPLARPLGGLKLYRAGNTYLTNCPPSILINSRQKVTCSINDQPTFSVDGQTLRLDDRNLNGIVKVIIREDIEDGRESEINMLLLDGAEWSKDRDGEKVGTGEQEIITTDSLTGFIGGWISAYSNDPNDSESVKGCWAHLKSKQVMPCTTIQTIKTRIGYMDSSTRYGPPSLTRDKTWREAIRSSTLHPVFSQQPAADLWKKFVSKLK